MKINGDPLVSIVIPVYNRESFINDAIRSSIRQTYKNIEIVIVDNCSTDNTWEVLKSWADKDHRIRIFQNSYNIGPVRNWERCFNEAKGEFVKILWSDDWMDDNFVEEAVKLMDKDTAFVMSSTDVVYNNGHIYFSFLFGEKEMTSHFYLNEMLYIRGLNFPVSPGCALFRTKDVQESLILAVPNSDGLDSSMNGAGNDLLLYLVIANKYAKIKTIPTVLNYFRAHKDSISLSSNIGVFYEWARLYFVETIQKDVRKLPIIKGWCNGYEGIENYLHSVSLVSLEYLKFWCIMNTREYNASEKNRLLDMMSYPKAFVLSIPLFLRTFLGRFGQKQ